MSVRQPRLLTADAGRSAEPYRERLVSLLSQEMGFHGQDSGYASHSFHPFPAKFPPQLPHKFIEALTAPGDVVLDPMMGSGTTVLEAYLTGRRAVGFDIDPLALLVSKTKVTPLDARQVTEAGNGILKQAKGAIEEQRDELEEALEQRWDSRTRDFVDYWFARDTQIELLALIGQIERVEHVQIRAFLQLAFSAIIVTKSGGVSLAFDLAHTRPHRAKVVLDGTGEVILGHDLVGSDSPRVKFLTKTLRSPLMEFPKRLQQNLNGLVQSEADRIQPYSQGLFEPQPDRIDPRVEFGDAQELPLDDDSVDLIVTSPPYASNAIDYMRAHKFSLVWMGYAIEDLGHRRKEYIGGEAVADFGFEALPPGAGEVVARIAGQDQKKGRVLHRYYSEMTRCLGEMFRVLKPGKSAVVVVGNSVMRGKDTHTQDCLAEIGQRIGFQVPRIGIRVLDRNRRMMPAGSQVDLDSQIQQRMHEEYVIGFLKPEA